MIKRSASIGFVSSATITNADQEKPTTKGNFFIKPGLVGSQGAAEVKEKVMGVNSAPVAFIRNLDRTSLAQETAKEPGLDEVVCVLSLVLTSLSRLIFLFAFLPSRGHLSSPGDDKPVCLRADRRGSRIILDRFPSLALKSSKEEMGVFATWRHFYYVCHREAVPVQMNFSQGPDYKGECV